ncbi:LysR substrate-binding domain-containing protein [Pseudomonas segetis]|uniref:Aminoethylphosphonate catabolism associated LysR family transcriptional regulator n=1 Tax=Pseudomonas segetis TaxID=298908 RepID=A0A239FJE2_9PSED|nr:LysR substrate-binding domain-containing protein [Pseudomonas segetis]SNS56935.1 aminoethylphosphonate catabolism associated LysR family transcriptional regulator [Pseudomonas segetis]
MAVSNAQLRAFHAVALTGSFTRAAQKLFLSQPAVSDQVRKLEEHFEILLFHRNKRSVHLTELGEQLLGITQRLYTVADEAQELLSNSSVLQTGSLTLAVDSPVHGLPFIARFNQRYPGIRVRLVTGNTDEVLSRLFAYKADVGIVGRPVEDERLLRVELSTAPLVAFVAPDHPWSSRQCIHLEDLHEVPMVLREQGSMTRQYIADEMRSAGHTLRTAIEVEGREAVFETVAAGLGVGIVSAAELGSSRSLHVLPIVDSQQYMTETLVCLKEQGSRRIIETFLNIVRESSAKDTSGV